MRMKTISPDTAKMADLEMSERERVASPPGTSIINPEHFGAICEAARFAASPHGICDAIVYIDGSETVAQHSSDGRKITSGPVGEDDQAIINAARSAYPNGCIYISSGDYSGISAIDLPSSGGGLFGSPGFGTRIRQRSKDANVINMGLPSANIHAVILRDLALSGTQTGIGIYALRAHRCVFENIYIPSAMHGIYVHGGQINHIRNPVITTNRILPNWADHETAGFGRGICFQYHPESYNACNANTIEHPCIEGGETGIYFSDQFHEGDNTIVGGVVEGQSVYGFDITGCTGFNVVGTHVELSPMRFDSVRYSDLNFAHGHSLDLVGCDKVQVHGGIFGRGIKIDSASSNCQIHDLIYAGSDVGILENYSMSSDAYNTRTPSTWIIGGRDLCNTASIFENRYLAAWDAGAPVGLNAVGNPEILKCGIGEEDTTHYSGSYSVLVAEIPGTVGYHGLMTDPLYVMPGSWISVIATIRAVTGTPALMLSVDGGEHTTALALGSDQAWQKVTASAYLPDDHLYLQIGFGKLYNSEDISFYLDSLEILVNSLKIT